MTGVATMQATTSRSTTATISVTTVMTRSVIVNTLPTKVTDG